MKRGKTVKILLFLISIIFISGGIFAHESVKIRVCISNIHTKKDLSALTGDVSSTLEFKGGHFFYNASGVVFKVEHSASYTVKPFVSPVKYYMDARGVANVKPEGFEGVALYEGNNPIFAISKDIKLGSDDGRFVYDSREYAQDIYFLLAKEGYVPINYVDVEEYLRGVVPAEMPHTWHVEALKAQSVAARTYAYRAMKHNADKFADILSTTADQAYLGVKVYRLESDFAISHTQKMILSHEGEPILAFYSSDNGGYTVESAQLPYLKAKSDPYSGSSKSAKWDYYVRFEQLEQALGIPKIKSVEISELDKSLRVSDLIVDTVFGSRTIRGSDFRKAIGYSKVKSTLFTISNDAGSSKEVLGAHGKLEASPNKPAVFKENKDAVQYYVIGINGMQKLDVNAHYVQSASAKSKFSYTHPIYAQGISQIQALDIGKKIEKKTSSTGESGMSVDPAKFLQSRGDAKVLSQDGGIYIKGLGYGHGMGMSQWGAKNRAEAGQSYQEILEFYYEGAVLENK